MSNPDIVRTYTNIPGTENVGELRVVAEPYANIGAATAAAEDGRRVLIEGLMEGLPGFGTRHTITEEQAADFVTAIEQAEEGRGGTAVNRRQVSLHNLPGGFSAYGELVGLAIYGDSMTPSGISSYQHGRRSAHVSAFGIVGKSEKGRPFSEPDMEALGYALLHGALLDAERLGFAEVSYGMEGVLLRPARAFLHQKLHLPDLGLNIRDVTPEYPVRVRDPLAMARTECAVGVPALRNALELRGATWLDPSRVIEPPSDPLFGPQ